MKQSSLNSARKVGYGSGGYSCGELFRGNTVFSIWTNTGFLNMSFSFSKYRLAYSIYLEIHMWVG